MLGLSCQIWKNSALKMVNFTAYKRHLKNYKKFDCPSAHDFPAYLPPASRWPRALSWLSCLSGVLSTERSSSAHSSASPMAVPAAPPNLSLLLSQDFCTCSSFARTPFLRYSELILPSQSGLCADAISQKAFPCHPVCNNISKG